MKCPQCDYQYYKYNEINKVTGQIVNENCGDFYLLPIELKQKGVEFGGNAEVYGCPKCGILFFKP